MLLAAMGRLCVAWCGVVWCGAASADRHPRNVLRARILSPFPPTPPFQKNKTKNTDVYLIPKLLDEEVARLHLPCLQAKLERLTTEQGAYIGVSPDGPFKDEFYRY